jgi:hypothetical protein
VCHYIDRKDPVNFEWKAISPDLLNYTLTPGAIDCDAKGKILFDLRHTNNNHSIRVYDKDTKNDIKSDDKYDYALEGEKKILKFFNNYVIEVKSEKG